MSKPTGSSGPLKSSWRRIQIIAQKEFSEFVKSKRLWIIIGAIIIIYILQAAFLRLYPSGVPLTITQVFSSTTGSIGLIAPFLGLALGYDAISRERESGTLRVLLSRPVYREDVVNGKILSSLVTIVLILFASVFLTASISIALYGVPISVEDFAKIFLFFIVSVIFSFAYYSISLFFSTVSRKSGYSLFFSIMVWAFFTIILPIIASFIAVFSAISSMPLTPGGTETQQFMKEYIEKYMEAFSSTYSTVMSFSINQYYSGVVNYIFPQQTAGSIYVDGEEIPFDITGAFPAYQTSLAVLILFPITFIILSYIVFTRREEK
jgi:ABC-2 type transport system permease protein